ncbi:MAG: tRNA (adenosine(37)-N6)-threonylcarbamoyltransferase complex dimerization subunit type 1 TsaB [Melioribacter sp.]|nr:tRNA (adenosine(37)-N6)-threonylcarbamoyltransferase complex dimerization subunit type 1 TsaB [Melioribacter sp.]
MSKQFPILAIETSGELCSIAVMLSEKFYIETNILGRHIHSEKIFDMIDYVVKNSKIELKDFAYITVSIGPGSFTGLRIGLSAAKGLALGSNLPIVPVPSIDAYALEVYEIIDIEKKFAILKTAGHEDFYFVTYKRTSNFFEKINDVTLIHKNELDDKIKDISIIFADKNIFSDVIKIEGPRAISIAKWSYLFGRDLLTYNYDYLEPYYLKEFVAKVKK